jgi:quinol monooxygenase YgiN
MYGTIARFRVKPGMEARLRQTIEAEDMAIPGHVSTSVYRMDADANEFMMAVVFESKEAYVKNADSPEQNARYEEFVSFLEAPPEWHDGEIVSSYSRAG